MSQVIDEAVKNAEERLAKFLTEAVATERYVDPDEMFAGWMPITMGVGDKKVFDFSVTDLQNIRDLARILSASDEVCINIIKHYQNHIVGDGIAISILPKDLGADPTKIASLTDDSTIKTMTTNWEMFWEANGMDARLRDWVKRAIRDGEVFARLFKPSIDFAGVKVPAIRFIDPYFIQEKTGARLGILLDPKDAETVKGYNYKTVDQEKVIKAEEIIHDKRNVDTDTLRGFSSFWSIFTNIRRISKNVVNVSVLTSILSAIALVRKHTGATQSKIDSFLQKNSDQRSRTNTVSGKTQYSKQMDPGTVLDANANTEYEFPAHTVQSKQYIEVIDKELAMVALAFVLPLEWLKSSEPATELSHGSPVVKNFECEQKILFTHIKTIFWKVQEMMGVAPEARLKYNVEFFGPTLSTASGLDIARINEIKMRSGVLSPQTWCAQDGTNYVNERANMIKHRETAQPGEVMPGDAGNTNVNGDQKSAGQGGDGQTKADGGARGAGASKTSKPTTSGKADG